jgi:hypothetical protein
MMMSTLRSVNALDLFAEQETTSAFRRFVGAVQTYWSAIREGLAAARTYQELTRQGASHETAVERVFEQHLGGR